MTNLDLAKKLQVFFGNFERKDIERLCNVSLDCFVSFASSQ